MATVAVMPSRGTAIVAPPRSNQNALEGRILDELKSLSGRLEESIRLGSENGSEIRSLRKELGMEGLHGRLPTIEAAVARIDRAQEEDHRDILKRVDELEAQAQLQSGGSRFRERLINIATSSAAVALLGWLAHTLGFIH